MPELDAWIEWIIECLLEQFLNPNLIFLYLILKIWVLAINYVYGALLIFHNTAIAKYLNKNLENL